MLDGARERVEGLVRKKRVWKTVARKGRRESRLARKHKNVSRNEGNIIRETLVT